MLAYCPTCGNLLLVDQVAQGADMRFYCQSCPYIYPITSKFTQELPLQRKAVDDVLGGEDAWKNVSKTEVTCPQCAHHLAYFMEIQIRSADEPATIFYKCVKCKHQWREG